MCGSWTCFIPAIHSLPKKRFFFGRRSEFVSSSADFEILFTTKKKRFFWLDISSWFWVHFEQKMNEKMKKWDFVQIPTVVRTQPNLSNKSIEVAFLFWHFHLLKLETKHCIRNYVKIKEFNTEGCILVPVQFSLQNGICNHLTDNRAMKRFF